MKTTTIEFIKKYSLVIIAITFCFISLFQISCANQSKPQQSNIDQLDKEKSKTDNLNTVKANKILQQKDSTIKALRSKLAIEKANTTMQRANAKKQRVLNDSLLAQHQREQSLNSCESLVQGLRTEISDKDSIIESLDCEIEICNTEIKTQEEKVAIQAGIINSKQNLIVFKDSVILTYQTQQKKQEQNNKLKAKIIGAGLLIKTIILLIK
jgi:hypothetical protein